VKESCHTADAASQKIERHDDKHRLLDWWWWRGGPPFSAQRALDLDGAVCWPVCCWLIGASYYLLGETEAKARTTFEWDSLLLQLGRNAGRQCKIAILHLTIVCSTHHIYAPYNLFLWIKVSTSTTEPKNKKNENVNEMQRIIMIEIDIINCADNLLVSPGYVKIWRCNTIDRKFLGPCEQYPLSTAEQPKRVWIECTVTDDGAACFYPWFLILTQRDPVQTGSGASGTFAKTQAVSCAEAVR
jgi:hypothetical protein